MCYISHRSIYILISFVSILNTGETARISLMPKSDMESPYSFQIIQVTRHDLEFTKRLIRKIRQVVPTSYRPSCGLGERLTASNKCVPIIKHSLSKTTPKPIKKSNNQYFGSKSETSTSSIQTTISDYPSTKHDMLTSNLISDFPVITDDKEHQIQTTELTEENNLSTNVVHQTTTATSINTQMSHGTTSGGYNVPQSRSATTEYLVKQQGARSSTSISKVPHSHPLFMALGVKEPRHSCHGEQIENLRSSAYEDYDY